ncbi:hypothetical protein [Caldinitratiruptor microaerophilus]|uniref:Uncharacterized protein n=1 Tax=Caldinitratiruptor microaerophilus TaxID=671077 RepID=A0AA35CM80_9FIRM|nr:hypothetical protein [Caldinitratiruptor microaerophilus]BDG59906.1 hypothetical protein caldi_09960 [Caldinitratiruptor microaerophilus]
MSVRRVNGVQLSDGVLLTRHAENRIHDAMKQARALERNPGIMYEDAVYVIGWLDGVRWLVGEMSRVTLALAQHPLVKEIDRRLPDPEYVRAEDILATVVSPVAGDDAEEANP